MNWKEQFVEMLFPVENDKLDIEGAYKLKSRHLPKNIFKYREVNKHSLKNLEEDTIWLSSPELFNDPFDCAHSLNAHYLFNKKISEKYLTIIKESKLEDKIDEFLIKDIQVKGVSTYDFIERILLEYSKEQRMAIKIAIQKVIDPLLSRLIKDNSDSIRTSFKLCSFSERNDSLPMWAHYAKFHKGFCIEYDLTNYPPNDYRTRFLFPVIYTDNIFDATRYYEYAKYQKPNILHFKLVSLIKAKDWKYEKEWRLVFSGGVIEEDQSYPMETPKAIYLGTRITYDDEKKIMEIAKQKNIEIYKMELELGKFELKPTLIS